MNSPTIEYDQWIQDIDRFCDNDPRRIQFTEEADKALLHFRDPQFGKPIPWQTLSKEFKKKFGFGHVATLKKRYEELTGNK